MLRHARIALSLAALLACTACPPPQPKERELSGSMARIADRYRKPEGSAATGDTKAIAGWADYDDARDAVAASDTPRAIASLKRAVAANPECAEYWYNLGAAQANRAIEVVNDSESEAVRIFGDSVDSKRRSLELMDQGRFQFYDEAAQAQVRSDAENGLRDADAVLADPASLVVALRMYAAQR